MPELLLDELGVIELGGPRIIFGVVDLLLDGVIDLLMFGVVDLLGMGRMFGVVDPLTGTTSECDLTGDATKMIAARFEAETGRPKPRGYVACRGALSEAFMDGALATHLPWSGLQAA